jgi:hypothetical protein
MSAELIAKCRKAIEERDEMAKAMTTMLRLRRERLAINRALTVVLDGIAAALTEHRNDPSYWIGPAEALLSGCRACIGVWPCPDHRHATASLIAIAEWLGVG